MRYLLVLSMLVSASAIAAEKNPSHRNETHRGRVAWMSDALSRQFGIRTQPEAAKYIIALEKKGGELIPIVEDVRGGAFRKDERLRGIEVEVLARRYEGSPMIQVIRLFQVKEDGLYEMDYWCDICSIAMYELKPCDCCQGPIELRLRKHEP